MGEAKPPKCPVCGDAARVFVTWVRQGKSTTAVWCERHAAEAGLLDPQGYALLDEAAASPRRSESTVRCPVCDCSQRDFERQGRFGCPACYGAFTGILAPMLQRMHRGAEHLGKIPERGADPAAVRHRLAVLQAALNEAVRTEKFEGAGQTRDTIAALKAKLLADSSRPPGA